MHTTSTAFNLIPVLPELFMACAAMALLMFGVFQKDTSVDRPKTVDLISHLAVVVCLLAGLLVWVYGSHGDLAMHGLFIGDLFAAFLKTLILIATAVTVIVSRGYLKAQNIERFEFPVLVLLAALGMMMMVSASDMMSLYMGLELQSLALYILAAFSRDNLRSTEAGLKYFVLGALASGLLLYGISLVYGFTGTTSFAGLAHAFGHAGDHGPATGAVIGLVFILSGLAFKISAVPFHMWTPDVYEGAPTPVTAFFAVAPKVAALGLILRVMTGPFGELVAQWQQIVVFVAIASMLLGAFAAIGQRNIKRLMAYSSIGHMGYALVGLAAGTQAGVKGVLVYMAIYLFMNAGAFTAILCMRRNERMVESIDDLAGLGKRQPMMALAIALFMFSLAGIPPLAGFFGKFYVFMAAIDAQLYGLAVIGVLASVVGAFYYVRIVKIMYFDEPAESFDRPIGVEMGAVMAVSGFVVLFFILYPAPLLGSAAQAAAVLFGS
ncbi:NADH-quinone oxidoreductase subunit NuoN [Magnetospira sp. QH-2]|uniref:NADH-quinone oxidoreductase subunit NuoN n=1 Tax=Magnetospira sp. (strain QH-2) TaxID=1288970 RepID=UPI0005FA4A2F|nr:NADH-quinone oxidoreductase subunit NuoN [Magnetospira sp. QH-2]